MYTRDGMGILFQLGAEVGHIMSCNMYIHRTRHTKHMIPTPFQSYDYETYSQMQEATPTLGVTLQMSKKRDLHGKNPKIKWLHDGTTKPLLLIPEVPACIFSSLKSPVSESA